MKHLKISSIIMILMALAISVVTHPITANAENLDIKSKSSILVDFETGKILYAENMDTAMDPASMTKMMTEYLILEAIDNGEVSWEDTTWISDYAYAISGLNNSSGVGLQQSFDFSIHDLYKAMAINSDNAATIALAELDSLAGSEGEFVKMMNQKAQEMGLTEAKFVNSTGLTNSYLAAAHPEGKHPEGTDPEGINLLSAKSTALLAYRLLSDHPKVLEFSSAPTAEFYGQTIVNWNWMLPHEGVNFKDFYYEGIDGLKTGNTGSENGYMFTGTAEQNGKRLITVIMGAESEAVRFNETARLMDYGFRNFQTTELFPAGYQLEDESVIPVGKGKEDNVEIELAEGFTIPVKQGEEELYSIDYQIDESLLNEDGELVAPIEKGQIIGKAELVYSGDNEYGYITEGNGNTVDLITSDSVEKANWFMLALGAIGDFFSGIFDTVKGWFS
ncbi:D-alanyl-D-alanine carboxypeptidase family protein [Ornithinibacillus halophilus]|uniref:serine-type D-Ala-D-Ala carboxypeptidase n=1 Tax=Ornithinibacillus halophilus TaxID=930117 RepID=A0A1M5MV20_9BACI|nr:D-alanyl-D-alanine carboxypeptidase family protein [Ornithinibacillus halophilus]SHG81148.1 D-Ala-D-Ala carboxypeptidase A. Serine peptidase. MEROPS family S11 [Ornithinibacillus halophilus]